MTTIPTYRSSNLITNNPCKVLIVDDSAVVRGVVRRTLESDCSFRVVDSVNNGEEAIKVLKRKDVDAIILDIEMPVMDGVTALPLLRKINPEVIILMASTLTQRNAGISLECMSKGASDYLPKPDRMGDADLFKRELIGKLKGLVETARNKKSVRQNPSEYAGQTQSKTTNRPNPPTCIPSAIAIGSSTGGPEALNQVLASLSGRISQPIFITQHMPESFVPVLCNHLSKKTNMQVVLGSDNTIVKGGTVYIAPGNSHMEVHKQGISTVLKIIDTPPENFCKPSVNPMFRSIAKAHPGRVLGIMLTGMGSDGLQGSQELIQSGSSLISQNEQSCVVYGMPKAVEDAGLCFASLPLNKIGETVISICNKQQSVGAACR